MARFANAEVVAANERVVLTEPLDASAPANRQLDDAGLRWVGAWDVVLGLLGDIIRQRCSRA